MDDKENKESVLDEGGIIKLDNRECKDNVETDIGDNQVIKKGYTSTTLYVSTKPDYSIFLNLDDEVGKKPNINDSHILNDIYINVLLGFPSI